MAHNRRAAQEMNPKTTPPLAILRDQRRLFGSFGMGAEPMSI